MDVACDLNDRLARRERCLRRSQRPRRDASSSATSPESPPEPPVLHAGGSRWKVPRYGAFRNSAPRYATPLSRSPACSTSNNAEHRRHVRRGCADESM